MASDRPKGSTSEVGSLDLEIGRGNHRNLVLGQAGTARQSEGVDVEKRNVVMNLRTKSTETLPDF